MSKLHLPDEVIQAIATDAMNLLLRRISASGIQVDTNAFNSRWEELQTIKREIGESLIPSWREITLNEDA